MEKLRSTLCLPQVRLPSFKDLRDGSFLRSLRSLEKEEAEKDFSWITELETKLVTLQEVALWTRPLISLAWVLATQMLAYHLTSSPLLPTVAKLLLATFLYTTWVYRLWPVIRVPPKEDEDSEDWTPVAINVLSAPEMTSCVREGKETVGQILSGLVLLHREHPGKFCILSSLACIGIAVLGVQVKLSTAFLLHIFLFLLLTLPALIIRALQNATLAPYFTLLGDMLVGVANLFVFRGDGAPPKPNKDLDEFVPEVTRETETYLEKALSYAITPKKEDEDDISLTSGLSIPSHEEVDVGSYKDLEKDLLPTKGLPALEISGDLSSDDEGMAPALLAIKGELDREEEEEEEDSSFSLDSISARTSGISSIVTGSVTTVTNTVSSMTSALMGSFLTKTDSQPDLEDFEMVNEADLELESP